MIVATVLYQGRETEVRRAEIEGDELWLAQRDLATVSGWEIKPEGICKDEICVPVPEARRSTLIRGSSSESQVNLTGFARMIEQPFAHDEKSAVWYFGPPGWEWKDRLASHEAPDFSLPDLTGKIHTLSELRGKKVLLLFWATW
jgi:AhpC/TSA family